MKHSPIRLLIADDHAVVRVGLVSMLALEEDLEIVAEACDGNQAVALYRKHLPDIVLLDVRMPGLTGIEALKQIRDEFGHAVILMLSTSELDEEVAQSLEAGAAGYILKSEGQDVIVEAIRAVAQGEKRFSVAMQWRLANRKKLSKRESEVLLAMSQGLCNKEIGNHLGISEHTVKSYIKSLFEKLDAPDRTNAVANGFAQGLLRVP